MTILSRHARPLRVTGLVLAGGAFGLGPVASGRGRDSRAASASVTTSSKAGTGAGRPEPQQSLGTKLMNQLEEWLLPVDVDDNSITSTLKNLFDVITEETKLSAEEKTRFPVNLLVLKAMHDRERMAAATAATAATAKAIDIDNSGNAIKTSCKSFDRTDDEIVTTAAHFASFAAAAYGVLGNMTKLLELVAKEASIPPPELLKDLSYLKKWYVSRHTNIATEDVRDIVTTGSLVERAYFVALDHSTRSVVLSIRGTYSVYDAMVDLVCNPTDFAGGRAHEGISKSALKVWLSAKDLIEELLREHDDYKLVLTGHSLGGGAAILLKIMLSSRQEEGKVVEASGVGRVGSKDGNKEQERLLTGLDAGRPVHVECFAFAPPPVFLGEGGSAETPDMYSFVNGFDCIPTLSLGSLYSLFRTVRRIDQLPLDVYQRVRFVLDTQVRLEHGGRVPDTDEEEGEESRGKNGRWDEQVVGDGRSEPSRGSASNDAAAAFADWKSLARLGDDFVRRFTHDIGGLKRDIGEVADTAGRIYEDIGQVAGGATVTEVVLLKWLQEMVGREGPEPDEVMRMVQGCEDDGRHASKESALGHHITAGDLVVPGRVYHLVQDGPDLDSAVDRGNSGGDGAVVTEWMGTARRMSSKALSRGIRLSVTMVSDHSMDEYEPKIVAAARRHTASKTSG